MLLGVKKVEEPYQELLEKANEDDLEEIRDSPCLPEIEWLKTPKFSEKTMLRIKLNPLPKVSYHLSSTFYPQLLIMKQSIEGGYFVFTMLPIVAP